MRRISDWRVACGLALLVLPLLGPVPARAASTLTLIGPSGPEPLEVPLALDRHGRRAGGLNLLLRNRGPAGRVRVRYVTAKAGAHPRATLRVGSGPARRLGPAGTAFALPGRDVLALALGFSVARRSTREVDGTLLFTPRARGRPAGEPLAVRVVGRRAEERGLAFAPPEMTMSVTLGPCLCDRGDRGTVLVRGTDAHQLLRAPYRPAAVLRTGGGGTAQLRLGDFRAEGPDAVRATVHAFGVDREGEYVGDLALGEAGGEPRLRVTVKAHDWFWLAVLFVVLGSLSGQFLPRLLGIRRRRERLLDALGKTERAYWAADRAYAHVASYDIVKLTGKTGWFRRRPKAGVVEGEVQEVVRDVRRARSEADFADVEARLEDVRARVERWIALERAAIPLAKQLDREHPEHGRARFEQTAVWDDSRQLRDRVRHDPGSEDAPALVRRLEEQTMLLEAAARVWDRRVELARRAPGLSGADAAEFAATDVDAICRAEPSWEERTPRDLARMLARLARAERTLAHLERAHRGLTAAVAVAGHEAPAHPGSARVAREPPSRLRRLARRLARWIGRLPERVWRTLREWAFGLEVLSSALAVAVPAVVYMTAVFNDTWGSEEQYLTAFAAGFLGTVAINWSAIPLLQSAWAHRPKPR